MNKDPRDRLLDSLLDEVLGGSSPPDLKHRIMRRLGEENSQRAATVEPPPVERAPRITSDHGAPVKRVRSLWALGVTTAAMVLVVGISAVSYLNRGDQIAGEDPEAVNGPSDQVADEDAGRSASPDESPPSSDGLANDRDSFNNRRLPFDEPRQAETTAGNRRVRPQSPALADSDVTRLIDQQLAAVCESRGIVPAERSDDAEWCRRAYLRLVGRIPAVNELGQFIDDASADKRERLVDRLLTSYEYEDEFVRHWSTLWANVLVGRRGGMEEGSPVSRDGLEQYLRDSIRGNKPFDEMAYELVAATGSAQPGTPDFNGAVNFLLASVNERGILATSRICRVFLGKKLQCAQCHHHPANGWGQQEFWQVNALLRQMKVERGEYGVRLVDRDFGGERRGSSEGEIYYERPNGEMKVAYPVLPDGTAIARSGKIAEVNRREALAQYLQSAPELSQAMVNRMWSHFFGYGFTRPVDDMGEHNPATHPELLDQLAGQFVAHQYDMRRLIRWMALSDAFQRSSRASEGNALDAPESGTPPVFARYYARQLQPEEVYQSLTLVAVASNQPSVIEQAAARQVWLGQISRNMGTDEGDETHAFNGGIQQSLIMMHGQLTQQAISTDEGTMLARLSASELPVDDKIEHLFLAAVARKPTRRELTVARRIVASRGDQEISGLQDIWWALLNSNEFILDH